MDKNLELLIEWCRKGSDSHDWQARRGGAGNDPKFHETEARMFRAAASQLEILQTLRTPLEF